MTPQDLSVRLFLQLAFILLVCQAVGWAFRRLGQSQVVSEMVAGVLMGPSLLGWLAPGASAYLFPAESKPIIYAIAQIGLSLYMFLVGLEFDVDLIRGRLRSAASVSFAGILAPFGLGALIALGLHGDPALFSPSVTKAQAVLFLGACMSITAFPMLARIIVEQGLARTSLGTLALAAGALDDAAAWCVLALVLASFQSAPMIALLAIGGGAAFAAFALLGLRPLLRPFGRRVEARGRLGSMGFTAILALVMACAWLTDALRIYAVFGAFLTGIAIPRGRLAEELRSRMLPFVKSFLLPVFFVYSGLNTRIGLLSGLHMAGIAALVLLAAVAGKGVACTLAARWHGEPWREALAIGTLMNARGLMELIILNIGLEAKVIQPGLFTVMVLMAVATTLMATPLFNAVRAGSAGEPGTPALAGPGE
ncbi:MAG: cation:proton antiporter [Holophagaceae bacterium]